MTKQYTYTVNKLVLQDRQITKHGTITLDTDRIAAVRSREGKVIDLDFYSHEAEEWFTSAAQKAHKDLNIEEASKAFAEDLLG